MAVLPLRLWLLQSPNAAYRASLFAEYVYIVLKLSKIITFTTLISFACRHIHLNVVMASRLSSVPELLVAPPNFGGSPSRARAYARKTPTERTFGTHLRNVTAGANLFPHPCYPIKIYLIYLRTPTTPINPQQQ
jgi:hypothetical protein